MLNSNIWIKNLTYWVLNTYTCILNLLTSSIFPFSMGHMKAFYISLIMDMQNSNNLQRTKMIYSLWPICGNYLTKNSSLFGATKSHHGYLFLVRKSKIVHSQANSISRHITLIKWGAYVAVWFFYYIFLILYFIFLIHCMHIKMTLFIKI